MDVHVRRWSPLDTCSWKYFLEDEDDVLEDKTSTWNMKMKKDDPWKNPRRWRYKSKKEKFK